MMGKVVASLGLATILVACSWSAELPGDEATNRKLLALWKSEPDRMARLKNNWTALHSLSKEQQDRLRQLDRDLHQLDNTTQNRLRGVMERYAGWLTRLSSDDRKRINASPAGPERLKIVDDLLDKQWQESLPRTDQEKLAKATGEDRSKLLQQLHKEDDDRHKLRLQARRTVEEAAVLGPLPFGQPEVRNRVESFVEESLRPLLNRQEEDRLNATGRSSWQRYFQTVFELSDGRTPLPFPGPAPPGRKKAIKNWADLPVAITEKFTEPMPARIADAEGRWPQLPMAVAAVAKEKSILIQLNLLGPTTMEELPTSVQRFVRDDLFSKLTDNEKRQLVEVQGLWPDYPMRIKELADRHRLQVPGLNLPLTREIWQNMLRAMRPGKAGMQPVP